MLVVIRGIVFLDYYSIIYYKSHGRNEFIIEFTSQTHNKLLNWYKKHIFGK